jgi:hypothetical protein
MFKSKTVFIVGAGASCEAGLPSGHELKKKIATLLDIDYKSNFSEMDIKFKGNYSLSRGDDQIVRALRDKVFSASEQRGDINPYLLKARQISENMPLAISIDNYLDAHKGDTELELCGKLAIAKSILEAEENSKIKFIEHSNCKFNIQNLEGTWYFSFFQMLTENVSKENIDTIFENVVIMTFNYDRCIETFLLQALTQYYNLDETKAIQIIKTLTIIHPYGKVGDLYWQNPNNHVRFGYSGAPLLPIAQQIKTFTEGLDDEAMIEDIHDHVSGAHTLVFLGFAFHSSNLELLAPKRKTNVERIFATIYGISAWDVITINHNINRMLSYEGNSKNTNINIAHDTCVRFFHQYSLTLRA